METSFRPLIGKNVIETLTSGMYEDPRFIFREYVQNSVDQIDIAVEQGILESRSDGLVQITIDPIKKIISVEDNATGVKAELIRRFLGDVANSEKDQNIRRGFRGIGRLGGLGYCDKLIFETSYYGEGKKSVMTLNARLLRDIIADRNDSSDAAAVISLITEVHIQPEDVEKHYFKVLLIDVSNNSLLDQTNVKNYLSLVAPIPYLTSFKYKDAIAEFFRNNNTSIDEFFIKLNTEILYKSYKNSIVNGTVNTNIIGIDFFKVNDSLGNLLAIGWYGFGDYVNIVYSKYILESGIRLRKNNIQIGSRYTLDKLFYDKRTNQRLIGELHVFNSQLIPNARRDYFNDNKTLDLLEESLRKLFEKENWENRYAQTASKLHNRRNDILYFKKTESELKEIKEKFDNAAQENIYQEKYLAAKQKALQASNEISKIEKKAATDKNVKKIFNSIIKKEELNILSESENLLTPNSYDPPTFSKLSLVEAEVAKSIINLIYESGISMVWADKLKKKIIDKFN